MRNNTVERRQCNLTSNDIVLDYKLILTDGPDCDMFDESYVYSVLIIQNEGGVTTEYEFLYDIARDEKTAVAILDTLVYNNVMPANARDVLADCL
jgi:hypothetical protein